MEKSLYNISIFCSFILWNSSSIKLYLSLDLFDKTYFLVKFFIFSIAICFIFVYNFVLYYVKIGNMYYFLTLWKQYLFPSHIIFSNLILWICFPTSFWDYICQKNSLFPLKNLFFHLCSLFLLIIYFLILTLLIPCISLDLFCCSSCNFLNWLFDSFVLFSCLIIKHLRVYQWCNWEHATCSYMSF